MKTIASLPINDNTNGWSGVLGKRQPKAALEKDDRDFAWKTAIYKGIKYY